MRRAHPPRPAPCDAAPLMALIARGQLEEIDAERARLVKVIAGLKPRRSTIVETRLKQLTLRAIELRVVIAKAAR